MRLPLRLALASALAVALTAPLVGRHAHAAEVDDLVIEARRLGRQFLAPDEERRRQATTALFELLAEEPDRHAELLREALGALAVWADRPERLEGVWREQLIEGDAATRRRAARLLHALGPEAIARLGEEAHHLRRGLGDEAVMEDSAPPPSPAADAASGTPATPEPAAAPAATGLDTREPRLVEAGKLGAAGMTPLDIRSFLERHADASRVVDFGGGRYMVLADPAGHARLQAALAAVGTTTVQGAGGAAPAAPPPPAAGGDEPAGADDGDDAEGTDADTDADASLPAWQLLAHAVLVPLSAASAQALPPAGRTRAGSLADGATWLEQERTRVEAREIRQWNVPIGLGGPAVELFAGRELPYNRSVKTLANGAWTIDTAMVRQGYAFRVALRADKGGVRVEVEATREQVSEPLPTVQVTPTAEGEPVTLHRPVWSRSSHASELVIEPAGGAVEVWLDSLGEPQPQGRVVLVLGLRPTK